MCGSVVSLIALIPMLAHSMLGCCWHHGHLLSGHDHSSPHAVQVAVEATGHRCCSSVGSSHQEPVEQQRGDHPDEGPCEEDRCDFEGASITVAPQPVDLESWGVCFGAPFEAIELTRLQATYRYDERDPRLFHSSGELRALVQVWLL